MGIQRTAVLLAISHSNHTWKSLTTSGASDYYLSGSYYNGTGHRNTYFKNDFNKFHGNPNILLGM